MASFTSWLRGLALGAGFMYFLDPARGNRRRALVRDQVVSMWTDFDGAVEAAVQDVGNRAEGWVAEAKAQLQGGDATDQVLERRVRAELGRISRHPGAIQVDASRGRVTLSGPILKREVGRVMESVSSVRGVSKVDNQLEIHDQPGDVPGLQGQPGPPPAQFELLQSNWTPAVRMLTGLAGGTMFLKGMRRGGIIGTLQWLLGMGMSLRAITNQPVQQLAGIDSGRQAIDFHKTINIDAPVETVYDFWSNLENFPQFMSHVEEVKDLGNDEYHWKVSGPAGTTVQFNALTTKKVPNETLAWRSVEGEPIKSAGTVHFNENRQGGTQIDVQMTYNPPAGALGHTIASIFGVDPKQAMDDDLVRLKSLLEEGKATADGQQVTREEVTGSA